MVVDIHSHMLPGVDDGAENFEMTKQMIKLSCDENCRHLFLTPHADALNNKKLKIIDRMQAVREWINERNLDIKIYQGAEIYFDPKYDESAKSIIKKIKKGIYPTLNNTNFVLIEFYFGGVILEEIMPAIKELQDAGYVPVIAHAERYGVSFDDLCEIKEMGCLFQMNLCDMFFIWETDVTAMAKKLLKEKMFDFVGTDAHNIKLRPPIMEPYIDMMYQNYDKEYIDEILYKNAIKYLNLSC